MAGNVSDIPFISQLELLRRLEALEAENCELRSIVGGQQEEIDRLRELTAEDIASDRRRIRDLEDRYKTVTSTTSTVHITRLHEQMTRFGTRQVTFNEAADLLGISKTHAHRLKQHLAADSRFAVVRDPHHKQRHLIRKV